MSSLTSIEDIKKLYERKLKLNGSTEPYSNADDDSQNSWRVTISSNRYDPEEMAKTVSDLTDVHLYEKLVELTFNAGPIVPSSKAIYEKKLLKLLQENTNGTGLPEEGNTNGEFSDQEERDQSIELSRRRVTGMILLGILLYVGSYLLPGNDHY